jgi:hypothetical protein
LVRVDRYGVQQGSGLLSDPIEENEAVSFMNPFMKPGSLCNSW